MPLKLKEDPREWRKSVLLVLPALALIVSLLRWHGTLGNRAWLVVLAALGIIALLAVVCSRWFRGYYRLSMRLGFALSQVIARVVLALVFVLLITPLALLFRLIGKDSLRLKRQKAGSYWVAARETTSLDRMF